MTKSSLITDLRVKSHFILNQMLFTMNASLVNPDFNHSVASLRRILPRLSFGLLIGTYLISAIIMGLFHAQESNSLGFTIAAFIVPLAIQAGRGTLVFFFQLNPARIQRKLSFGVIAATILLLLSLGEACLVMYPQGLAWTVSVSTLMVIGWIIEVMILQETQFSTELELYGDPNKLEELKQFYLAKKEFGVFMENLQTSKGQVVKANHQDNRRLTDEKEKGIKRNHNKSMSKGLGKPLSRIS